MTEFPSQERYREVLRIASHWMTPKQRKMLTIHLNARNQTTTVTQMAEAMKFENYGAVNLHYGFLASKIAERMKWTVPDGEPELTTLVAFDRTGPEEHWKLIMRPQLVAALQSLGWK